MTARIPRAVLAALALLLAALAFAACGETQDDQEPSSGGGEATATAEGEANPDAPIKEGLKTVSIPKQLGNPYEETEHSGVDEALQELGGSNRINGPTDASASSQISIINSSVQQKPDAIIIAGNDPNAVAPALKQAAQRDVAVVAMDSDVAPDARTEPSGAPGNVRVTPRVRGVRVDERVVLDLLGDADPGVVDLFEEHAVQKGVHPMARVRGIDRHRRMGVCHRQTTRYAAP